MMSYITPFYKETAPVLLWSNKEPENLMENACIRSCKSRNTESEGEIPHAGSCRRPCSEHEREQERCLTGACSLQAQPLVLSDWALGLTLHVKPQMSSKAHSK